MDSILLRLHAGLKKLGVDPLAAPSGKPGEQPPAAEVTEAMLEAGAQALANDVWHPPQPLASLSSFDANKFRRQALIVLKAALSPLSRPHHQGGE
jgi:hypothetical protein